MRATATDVLRHPSWLRNWWIEWPARRRHFWQELLFAEGQGWLRWGKGERTAFDYSLGNGITVPEPYTVAPPLRRLLWYIQEWIAVPRLMVIGYVVDEGQRERLSWADCAPSWKNLTSWFIDEDRHQELWGSKRRRRKRR